MVTVGEDEAEGDEDKEESVVSKSSQMTLCQKYILAGWYLVFISGTGLISR